MRPTTGILRRVGVFIGVIGLTALTQGAPRCVELKVRPRVLFVRQDIQIEMRIRRHEDHRRVELVWTVDGIRGGSTDRELAGASAAFLHVVGPLRDQDPGEYEFVATVFDQLGHVVGRDQVTVRGPDHTDPFAPSEP